MQRKQLFVALVVANAVAAQAWAEETDENPVMEEVVVSATMSARAIETAPAFTSVMTAEQIESSPVDSLGDLLRITAGVNNLSDTSGRDEIQIRGLEGQYTLMLVNGKRISSGGAFAKGSDADFNSIPMSAIERVEVIRGPMAALYGSDAIGGVINIITKKSAGDWRGSVGADYTSVTSGDEGNRYRVGGNVMGSLTDMASLSVTAETYSRDAWYANSEDDVPEQEEKQSTNLASTLTLDIADNQSVDIDLGYNQDDRPRQLYSSGSYRDQSITRYDVAVTHTGEFGDFNTTAFLKYENSDVDDYNTSYTVPQHHTQESNIYGKTYATTMQGIHSLVAGLDFRHQELEDPVNYVETGKYSIDQYAGFLQDELALTDDLLLTLGGRYDHHEVFGGHVSPKAYLVYQLNDSVTLKGGAGKAFKAPDGRYLSPEYNEISCGGSCYIPGNPDLKPESSVSKEFGIEVVQPIWSLSADVFKTDVKDKIERELGDAVNGTYYPQWVNRSKVTSKGYEMSGDLQLGTDWFTTANYTRLIVKDEDGAVVEDRPEHQANLSIDWQTTDSLKTMLKVNYIGGINYSYWVSGVGTQYVKMSYYRTDLNFKLAATDDLDIKFGVNNLADVNLQNMDANVNTVQLGRNYFVGGTYNF
ncbi:TonB-dependent receptor plug domain-containing protein [Oceanobacter mangrovi]|uniref:TonB-dependent receptor plug domain-containing protein n=1 Tax=Oceanobacter mangrovi TaxID=2862510 RepID=UPI001C8D8EF1|nr:TonB-dependent receptor [Oceanobacter mangrovi]